MYCVQCGHKLPDEARFCGACGAPVSEEPAPTTGANDVGQAFGVNDTVTADVGNRTVAMPVMANTASAFSGEGVAAAEGTRVTFAAAMDSAKKRSRRHIPVPVLVVLVALLMSSVAFASYLVYTNVVEPAITSTLQEEGQEPFSDDENDAYIYPWVVDTFTVSRFAQESVIYQCDYDEFGRPISAFTNPFYSGIDEPGEDMIEEEVSFSYESDLLTGVVMSCYYSSTNESWGENTFEVVYDNEKLVESSFRCALQGTGYIRDVYDYNTECDYVSIEAYDNDFDPAFDVTTLRSVIEYRFTGNEWVSEDGSSLISSLGRYENEQFEYDENGNITTIVDHGRRIPVTYKQIQVRKSQYKPVSRLPIAYFFTTGGYCVPALTQAERDAIVEAAPHELLS